MTTFAAHLIEAAWALRILFAVVAALIWFACRWVKVAGEIDAVLNADIAEREREVATWDQFGRLTSVAGMEPGAFIERVKGIDR